MKQFLLKGSGYSGRGVRVEFLNQEQCDGIREEAARGIVSADASDEDKLARQQIFSSRQKKLGVAAMVVGVTDKTGFKTQTDLAADGVKWTKPSAGDLTSKPEKYFTPKDLDALGDLFFRYHMATKAEVDDIMGEALDVTEA